MGLHMFPAVISLSFHKEFHLRWVITYSDAMIDSGTLKFEADPESGEVKLAGPIENWNRVLPILVNELELTSVPSYARLQFTVPPYEEAAFILSEPEVSMSWHVHGIGVGQFCMRTRGGHPILDNYSHSKNTILRILQNVAVPV